MTNGDLLRKLFTSYKRRDDQAFAAVAQQIVDDERNKHHNLLAEDLSRILEGASSPANRRASNLPTRRLEPLSKPRDSDDLLFDIRQPRHSLNDILLSKENESTVYDVLRQFKHGDRLRSFGLSPSSHLLFCGPPGCGKSLCADVIAFELDLPLLYVRFDGIISSYLGETAANLRKVFDFARRGSWVVFFDEFDAIGKDRNDIQEHGELKRVVNSFLQLLDNFSSESLVIAATNHEGLLDPALWRRFDEILLFAPPSQEQIIPLLSMKLGGIRHIDVDLEYVATLMVGLTQADIERVCRDAIKERLLENQASIVTGDLVRSTKRQRRRLSIASPIAKNESYGYLEDVVNATALPDESIRSSSTAPRRTT